MRTDKKNPIKIALVLAISLLAGCASLKPPTPEQAVEARALEYWKARIEGKLDKAYTYTPPSFRAARTFDQYRLRFGSAALIKDVEVYSVTCEPLKCSVRMQLVAQVNLPMLNIGKMNTYMDEIWLLEEGNWWRFEDL